MEYGVDRAKLVYNGIKFIQFIG